MSFETKRTMSDREKAILFTEKLKFEWRAKNPPECYDHGIKPAFDILRVVRGDGFYAIFGKHPDMAYRFSRGCRNGFSGLGNHVPLIRASKIGEKCRMRSLLDTLIPEEITQEKRDIFDLGHIVEEMMLEDGGPIERMGWHMRPNLNDAEAVLYILPHGVITGHPDGPGRRGPEGSPWFMTDCKTTNKKSLFFMLKNGVKGVQKEKSDYVDQLHLYALPDPVMPQEGGLFFFVKSDKLTITPESWGNEEAIRFFPVDMSHKRVLQVLERGETMLQQMTHLLPPPREKDTYRQFCDYCNHRAFCDKVLRNEQKTPPWVGTNHPESLEETARIVAASLDLSIDGTPVRPEDALAEIDRVAVHHEIGNIPSRIPIKEKPRVAFSQII